MKRLDDTSSEVRCLALEALNVIPKCIPEGFKFGPDNKDFIKSMFEQVLLHMDDKNVRMRGKVLGKFFFTAGTTVYNIYCYSYGFSKCFVVFFDIPETLKHLWYLHPTLFKQILSQQADKHKHQEELKSLTIFVEDVNLNN